MSLRTNTINIAPRAPAMELNKKIIFIILILNEKGRIKV